MSEIRKTGSLTINSENIFPIIKKWLYQDHDIFYRELISNGCDAVTKLKKLSLIGEYTAPEDEKYRIDVTVDTENKTLSFEDNGIGMTAEELDKYINQIAFSGAVDFLDKYKDKASNEQIIGHFGLGFYSAFMVADKVTIDTLSYAEGAEPVHWESDGGTEFTMEPGTKQGHGTVVTLWLNEESLPFCNEYKSREVLEKYCSFMPVEIYLHDVVSDRKKAEEAAKKAAEAKTEEKKDEKEPEAPKPLNETSPLWNENPSKVTDEQYKEFYRKVFRDFREPLFWIHLNMDYPFNLKGILYFPKINLEYESLEGVIKLYNNQVFIADNIKEVIPEYLMLLKGVIDCPDFPLNVSRSALQNDGFVKKISDYISKKVADKLSGMCKSDRENYEKYWDDISPFIKYGCLKDEKFCEKMTDYILFKDLDGKYLTLPEALEVNARDTETESASDENGEAVEAEVVSEGDLADSAAEKDDAAGAEEEKKERTIYYVTNVEQQSQYVRMFRENGMQAFVLSSNIDQPFISQLEAKNEGVHFARIDADLQDALRAEDDAAKDEEKMKEDGEKLEKIVRKALDDDKLAVKLETLKDAAVSSMLTVDERTRRMKDMMKMYSMNGMDFGMGNMGREGQTLVLNSAHPLVQYVLAHSEDEDSTSTRLICEQLYDLAVLQNEPLTGDEMAKFVTRSNEIMMILAGLK